MKGFTILTFVAPTVLGLGIAAAVAIPQLRDSLLHKASGPAPEVAEQAADPDKQKNDALDHLLKCSNFVDNALNTSEQRYHSWVKDKKKGPTGREHTIVGMATWDDSVLKMCNQQFDANKNLQQFGDLAKLSEDYRVAINDLIPKVDEAAKYYNKEMYKADKFEKGKKMHPDLEKAFQVFVKASDALSPEIEKYVTERSVKNLAAIEKDEGHSLHYWHRKSMLEAKSVQRLVNAEKVDYDKLEAALKSYGASVDELEKAQKTAKEVPLMWAGYKNHPRAYYDAVAFFVKRHKNNIKFTRDEQMRLNHGIGDDVPGSSDNVVKEYNGMIDGSNAVNYDGSTPT
ncbi:MAG: DUF3829 domain-containing protein [Polyangiaceae bacterium]|nr:DUF3829 domain-containing protein [Myxococcales bacterium]MCB9586038.1 DUF3829 domain-containing protein [Polyangiaceae bacterium]MCB9608946.1 DUF3829 domain-containing protein [Polyangiaceae bacterium]